MTAVDWGACCGGAAGLGVVLVVARVSALRRPRIDLRVLHYLRDLPELDALRRPGPTLAPGAAASGLYGPWLAGAAARVDRWFGGAASVQRRLEQAGSPLGLAEFRVQQVLWGLTGFAVVAALGLLRIWSAPTAWPFVLLLCLAGLVLGVMLRENRLSAQVKARHQRSVAEFPSVAELLALAVAAGEGPVPALDRVVRRSSGPLATDLGQVLAQIRTGVPFQEAFEGWGDRSGVPVISRFARAVSVAVERGTPLSEVLHAQVADVREVNRRALIENAARREVLMMAPVVFLVLPVVIAFAFFPGLLGLHLSAP
jgi:tight adherence protein C